jgi:hypothetical protein
MLTEASDATLEEGVAGPSLAALAASEAGASFDAAAVLSAASALPPAPSGLASAGVTMRPRARVHPSNARIHFLLEIEREIDLNQRFDQL